MITAISASPLFGACKSCKTKSDKRSVYSGMPFFDRFSGVLGPINAGFSSISESYWQGVDYSNKELYPEGVTFSIQPELLKHLKKDDAILQVGSRHGQTLIQLAEKGFNNLTGVELNAHAVEQANQHALKTLGTATPPVFLQGSVHRLPFKTNQFDVVLLQGLLSGFVKDNTRASALKEVHRVLKPGGIAYIEEFGYFPRLKSNKERYELAKKMGLPKGVIVVKDPYTDASHLSRHFMREELLQELNKAGFKRIVTQEDLVLPTRSGKKNQGHLIVVMKLPDGDFIQQNSSESQFLAEVFRYADNKIKKPPVTQGFRLR